MAEVIVIDTEAYFQLQQATFQFVHQKFRELLQQQEATNNPLADWIPPDQARKILCIGKTKYHELKNAGVLRFTQHGRKVLISKKSVLDFMKKNSTL
jgi:hypothetical protein